MKMPWSIRRTASVALLLAFAAVPVLAGIAYLRLYQLRSQAPRWAQLADSGRRLSQGLICNGATGSTLARDDMDHWQSAVAVLVEDRGEWLEDPVLAQHLMAFRDELAAAVRDDAGEHVAWVLGHCADVRALAGRSLEQSLRLGLSPSSRADRYEDRGIRDVTVFLAVWLGLAVVLLFWVRKSIVRPAQLIINTLLRVADGDLDAKVPRGAGGEMSELADALDHAIRRFDRRDHLKVQRIVEMRNLVERVLAFVEAPVIIIGVDGKIDYVNDLAAEALGAPVGALQSADLARVPGGEALKQLVEQVLTSGVGHEDHPLDLRGVFKIPHVARCTLVRDGRGAPTRVVVMLEAEKGAWWQRMWQSNT
jgi:PAS domain-containing protein